MNNLFENYFKAEDSFNSSSVNRTIQKPIQSNHLELFWGEKESINNSVVGAFMSRDERARACGIKATETYSAT